MCGKQSYSSEKKAIDSQKIYRKIKSKSNYKPYYAYKCQRCKRWHISTKNLPRIISELIMSNKSVPIRKISSNKYIHQVILNSGKFIVEYDKKSKRSKIVGEIV